MPNVPSEVFAHMDFSGTPLENLSPEELENLNDLDWQALALRRRIFSM